MYVESEQTDSTHALMSSTKLSTIADAAGGGLVSRSEVKLSPDVVRGRVLR